MSPISNVPSITFESAGIVIPSETAVLAGVQTDMNAAFGGGLNPALETPQGQLASSQAAIIADKNSQIAYIVNQVDPQYAEDRFQDAIGRFYFMTRKSATATTVVAPLIGVVGTPVHAGTLAKGSGGTNIYALQSAVTIDASGSTAGTWVNTSTGPIAADASLSVYQAVSGWDSVGAIASVSIGSNLETRAEFEYRRKNSVAINGKGTPQAIQANVFSVPGVTDCYVIDNPSNSTVNSGSTNYPLAPHSIYVAVTGTFDPQAVAQAIWNAKDAGCSYNGNTTKTVVDNSNYNYPYPAYQVSFETPSALPILFAITIINNSTLPSNIISLVQAAIIARFKGTDSVGTPERIGSTVFASRYYDAIAAVASNVYVSGILIGTSSPTAQTIQVGIDQAPTISASNIAVTIS